MGTKRGLLIATVVVAAALVQGCALVYIQDSDLDEKSRVREIGVLGGCIPIFSYRTHRSEKTEKGPMGNTAPDEFSVDGEFY